MKWPLKGPFNVAGCYPCMIVFNHGHSCLPLLPVMGENVSSLAASSVLKCNLLESDSNHGVTFRAFGSRACDHFLLVNALYLFGVAMSIQTFNVSTLQPTNRRGEIHLSLHYSIVQQLLQ